MAELEGFRAGYVPAVATVEDRLAGQVGQPARHVVQHVTGWRIDWTEGARLAEVFTPDGELLDAVQVIGWEWAPPEGGPSRADGPPPTDVQLADALAEYVAGVHESLGLPGLGGR